MGNAKVILAQLSAPPRHATEARFRRRRTADAITAMERHSATEGQWTEIWSEILRRAFLLGNLRMRDVSDVATGMRADRIFLSTPQLAERFWSEVEETGPAEALAIPAVVLGARVNDAVPERMGRILLPLSLRNEFETRLRIACSVAKDTGATLAVLHVVPRSAAHSNESATPWTVRENLQQFFNECSESPCDMEISVRDGDPVEAILKLDAHHPHHLVIVRMSTPQRTERRIRGAVRRLLNEVRCPVLLLHPDHRNAVGPVEAFTGKADRSKAVLELESGGVQ